MLAETSSVKKGADNCGNSNTASEVVPCQTTSAIYPLTTDIVSDKEIICNSMAHIHITSSNTASNELQPSDLDENRKETIKEEMNPLNTTSKINEPINPLGIGI